MEYTFHPPLPEALLASTDEKVVTALVESMEREVREKAPTQVMVRFLLHRELRARDDKRKQELKRREKP